MVQIVNMGKTASGMLAESLGQAAGEFGGAVGGEKLKYERNKGRLQEALGKVKALGDRKEGQGPASPYEVAATFMEAAQLAPGSERYLGQLLPLFLQKSQGDVTPTVEQIKGGQQTTIPGNQQAPNQLNEQDLIRAMGQSPTNIPSAAQNQEPPSYTPAAKGSEIRQTLGQYLPLDVGDLITPEQRATTIDKVRRNGGDVEFAKNQIDEFNRGKIDLNSLSNAQVDKMASQRVRQRQMEQDLSSFVNKQYANDAESDKNVYYDILKKEVPKHEDYTSAQNNVAKTIEDYKQQRDTLLKQIPDGDLMGIPQDKVQRYRGAAQNLLKISPLAYNVIEQGWIQKGHSPVQVAEIYNPLSPKIQTIMDKANDYKFDLLPLNELSDQAMIRDIKLTESRQDKELETMVKQLKSNWDDSVSLMNIYADLRAKGWFPDKIIKLFDDLQSNVTFGSQQARERQQLVANPKIPIRRLNK